MFTKLRAGHLEEAKDAAKKHTWAEIYTFARMDMEWSQMKSSAAANFLKGKASFETFMNAE